jgi:hypothetical protein
LVIVYPNQALEARFIDRHIRIAWTGRDYDKGDHRYDPYGPGDFLDHTASVTAQQRRPLRRNAAIRKVIRARVREIKALLQATKPPTAT